MPILEGIPMVSPPTLLRITAHATPHHSDPPDADEFYAMLGKFTVAWSRFEGHFSGALLQILAMPEAALLAQALPLSWKQRAKLWRGAFNTISSLHPKQRNALDFIKVVMDEVQSRHIGVHAIWDEFVPDAQEPTILARTVNPEKSNPAGIIVTDYRISLSMVHTGLVVANALNRELIQFTTFLDSLRPPPVGIRTL
jgi:hypothetical protein